MPRYNPAAPLMQLNYSDISETELAEIVSVIRESEDATFPGRQVDNNRAVLTGVLTGPVGPRPIVLRLVKQDGGWQVDDVIFGANGRPFAEKEDPRPEMGNALIESQSPQLGGILALHVVRDRKPINVKVDLGNTLSYSDTWPLNCEKTRQMRQDAVTVTAGAKKTRMILQIRITLS